MGSHCKCLLHSLQTVLIRPQTQPLCQMKNPIYLIIANTKFCTHRVQLGDIFCNNLFSFLPLIQCTLSVVHWKRCHFFKLSHSIAQAIGRIQGFQEGLIYVFIIIQIGNISRDNITLLHMLICIYSSETNPEQSGFVKEGSTNKAGNYHNLVLS